MDFFNVHIFLYIYSIYYNPIIRRNQEQMQKKCGALRLYRHCEPQRSNPECAYILDRFVPRDDEKSENLTLFIHSL